MRREAGKKIRFLVLLFLTIFFFLLAAHGEKQLHPFAKKLSYAYESEGAAIEAGAAYGRQADKKQTLSSVWWTDKGKETIENQVLGSQSTAEILAVCGRTDLLFADAPVLDYDQTSFCILGYRTASQLFGDTNAIGLKVEYGGKTYKVAGVLKASKDVFLYEAGKEENLIYSRAAFRAEDPASRPMIKNKVEAVFSPDTYLDYDLLIFIAQLTLLAIPTGIAVRLLRMLSAYRKTPQAGMAEKLVWWGLFLLPLLVFLKLAAANLDVPPDLIPAKWSDFPFWSTLWREKKESLAAFFQIGLTSSDLLFFTSFWKTVFYGIAGFLCFMHMGKETFHGKNCATKAWKSLRGRRRGRKGLQSGN